MQFQSGRNQRFKKVAWGTNASSFQNSQGKISGSSEQD